MCLYLMLRGMNSVVLLSPLLSGRAVVASSPWPVLARFEVYEREWDLAWLEVRAGTEVELVVDDSNFQVGDGIAL
jgi:hypothetical protein